MQVIWIIAKSGVLTATHQLSDLGPKLSYFSESFFFHFVSGDHNCFWEL